MEVLLLLLPLLGLTGAQYDYADPDLVGDIFGGGGGGGGGYQQQTQQHPDPYTLPPAPETRCNALKDCVECSALHQYWHQYPSALECYLACKEWSFVTGPSTNPACTLEMDPHCGIDGQEYSNKCAATSQGVGVACRGRCPCPSTANVCSFDGDGLESLSDCKAYKFVIDDDSTVYVYQELCSSEDYLQVNVGKWKGRTTNVGYETFPYGYGELEYDSPNYLDRQKFLGTMSEGVFEGYGTLFWNDGSLYSGQFENNTKRGEGTLFYSNGDIFSGMWSDERKTGDGRYIFKQGPEYIGGFSAGAQNGQGDFQMKDSEGSSWDYFKGEYQGGQRKNGEYMLATGDLYSGEFETTGGLYQGNGKYVWDCGKVYTGQFKNGQPDGEGVLELPHQGWRYTGSFVDGKFDGQGTFSWNDDNYYTGTFSQGEMTGQGAYFVDGGGLYEDGKYYPNRSNRNVHFEAVFDGETLRFKKPITKGGDTKKGYGK